MATIGENDLLLLWEAAQNIHPVLRPAALLRAAGVDDAPECLPIGVRDRRLLALRERCFGGAFESLAECPQCGVAIEASFETPPPVAEPAALGTLRVDDAEVEYRLPDTNDLAAVAGSSDAASARAQLAARCVTRLHGELSEAVIAALSEAMAAADPDGDIHLAMRCPDCEHEWDALFDPAAYLWRELEAGAMRVLRDVDALASAYGWSEREILALSRARRGAYLALVTS